MSKIQELQDNATTKTTLQVDEMMNDSGLFERENIANFFEDNAQKNYKTQNLNVTCFLENNCKVKRWKPDPFTFGRYTDIGKLLNSVEV